MATTPKQEAVEASYTTETSENRPIKSNIKKLLKKESSTSELFTSATEVKQSAAQKQKRKKKKEIESIKETNMEEPEKKGLTKDIADLIKQTRQINSKLERLDGCMNRVNKKLENVMMKGTLQL
ncbi:hypothetical protein DPMN_122908 [Dreissena polymorpha]|uniref:Uncharacterized protein n=1 Tax=Dreissena polymorpha TaxID=45954 RepID=A0A9D4JUL9_DREPO|nr:hypothetical protein DPMN_122908 [Dreissena polymorpha]